MQKAPKTFSLPEALTMAAQYLQNNELHQAEDICHKILKASPNQPDALHILGYVVSKYQRHPEAIELITTAIKLNNNLAMAHYHLAMIYQDNKQFEQAVDWYAKGLAKTFKIKQVSPDIILDLLCHTPIDKWHSKKQYIVGYANSVFQLDQMQIDNLPAVLEKINLNTLSEYNATFLVFVLLDFLQFSKLSNPEWNQKIFESIALPLMQQASDIKYFNLAYLLRIHIFNNFLKQETLDSDVSSYQKHAESIYKIPTESDIMAKWDKSYSKPVVSILCVAYNHEKFISDAIEGFLIQNTQYPYEIIIHDDASTDNTVSIIQDYQRRYPNIIKTMLQQENQFSKGEKPLDFILAVAQGNYIALCEGDDFWIDKSKLQKQIAFLEKNPDYSCYFHNYLTLIHNTGCMKDIVFSEKKLANSYQSISQDSMKKVERMARTPTLVFRKHFTQFPRERKYIRNGDKFLTSFLGIYGKGAYFEHDYSAMYRHNDSSSFSPLEEDEKNIHNITSFYWIAAFYARTKDDEMYNFWAQRCHNKLGIALNRLAYNYFDN